jgi:uncharacterized membrane protein
MTGTRANLRRTLNRDVVTALSGAGRVADDFRLPGWLTATEGEHRLPVTLAVLAAMAMQLSLPPRLSLGPSWGLPLLEGLLTIMLIIANPLRLRRHSRPMRVTSLLLVAAITLGNAISAVVFVSDLLYGRHNTGHASTLLAVGGEIYLTNIIAFALWYWELDRGGPVLRSLGTPAHPDLLFPQMTMPELTPDDWHPRYGDYLYVSFTNATAFSPTDTLPLSRWVKLLMALQSAVSLAVVGLVIARAVNILGS